MQNQKEIQTVKIPNNNQPGCEKEQYLKEHEEIEKHSQPMWITDKFVEKNNLMLFITAAIFILALVIVIAFGLFGLSETVGREFLIWDDEKVQTMDIFREIQTQFKDFQDKLTTVPERSQQEDKYNTHIILECQDCENVLTAESIKKLYQIEQNILKLPNYKNFCLATSSSTDCSEKAILSLTQEFPNPSQISDQDVKALITRIQSDEAFFTKYKILFSKTFTPKNASSLYLRTLFKFGTPIMVEGRLKPLENEDKDDFEDEQLKAFEGFSEDFTDASRSIEEPSGIRIIEYSKIINNLETKDIIMNDFKLIIISVIFVLTYMACHLKSLFLSCMAMFNIVMSFPLTLLIFRLFQVTYFSNLHILAIFIVLGIAADDVFVFIDAWDQSAHLQQLNGCHKRRMAYTFRRAAKAMLATSSTTAACFFATGLSEIMPLSSFGIFAGILVPMNFALVITVFPTFVMFFEKKLKKFKYPCQKKQQQQQTEPAQGGSKIELFFENFWTTYTHKFRIPILIGFAIWVGISIWQASKLEPVKEEEEFLPDSLETIYAEDLIKNEFHLSHIDRSVTLNIYYIFGVTGINREGISRWDPKELGKIQWDENFDLSPPQNQQWLYNFCTKTRESELVLDNQVSCFMPSFKSFIETEKSLPFPVPQTDFFSLLQEYTRTPIGQNFFNRKDIGIIDNKLKYLLLYITAKGVPMGGYDTLNPQFESWESFKTTSIESAPEGLKTQKQTALLPWVWMPTERAFVSNAVEGILISIMFSFIVLLITSGNLLTSFYSMLSIVGVIVSVISVIILCGWELGVSESIALVIIIGLSVDYVVHLANHYIESVAYPTRLEKVRVSLKEIGVSIVSGAITTIGSGICLLFAKSLLFNKFAILILSTITFAVLFSLIFFIAVLHVAGPIGGTGSVKALIDRIRGKKNSGSNEGEGQTGDKVIEIQTNSVKVGRINQNQDHEVSSDPLRQEAA